MNDNKSFIDTLRSMTSEEAADFLIASYPINGSEYMKAIQVLRHRSWRRKDQLRISSYYLEKIPFANGWPYEVFASFMSVSSFLRIIETKMPDNTKDRELLLYYLIPIIKKSAKTSRDADLIECFKEKYQP